MIGVQIDNTFAELNEDTSISVELMNPVFNDGDIIKGSATLPFNLPGGAKSEINSRLFKNPDVIGNIESFRAVPSKLYYAGVPFKTGKLKTSGYNKNTIQAHYVFGLSTLADDFKTAKLRDVVKDQDGFGGERSMYSFDLLTKGFNIKNAVSFPLKIYVNDVLMEPTDIDDLRFQINTKTDGMLSCIKHTGSTPLGESGPYLSIVPNTLGETTEWPISIRPFEDTDAERAKWYIEPFDLSDYNTAILSAIDFYENDQEEMFFPFFFNNGMYPEGNNAKPNIYVNARNSSGMLMNTTNPTGWDVNVKNSLQPFLKLSWVLAKIEAYFGVKFEGDWVTDADTQKMFIDNGVCFDVAMPYLGAKQFIFFRNRFNITELLPDISVVALLKALQNRYNLAIYQNDKNGNVIIKKREPIVTNVNYIDITPFCGPAEAVNDQRLTGIRLVATIDDTDEAAGEDAVSVLTPEQEIKTDCSALSREQTITAVDGETGNVTGPWIDRKPSSKFPLRIFYSLGIVDNGSFTYQGASINAAAYDDKFEGEDGLYEKLWKNWINKRISRKVVELRADFPFRAVRDFNWDEKVRFDRSNYLIYSISVQFTMKRVTASRVKLYTS